VRARGGKGGGRACNIKPYKQTHIRPEGCKVRGAKRDLGRWPRKAGKDPRGGRYGARVHRVKGGTFEHGSKSLVKTNRVGVMDRGEPNKTSSCDGEKRVGAH